MIIPFVPTKFLVYAAAAALAVGAFWGYGKYNQRIGASNERAKIEKVQQEIAAAEREARDKADAIHRGRVLATEARADTLTSQLANSQRLLNDARKRLAKPGASARLNDAGTDWLGVIGSCWAEYGDMGKDAARIADKLRGLQDYVDGVRKAQISP